VTEVDAGELARDLRKRVSDFVRAVRQDTGTERSAQSDTLDIVHRSGPMNVAALAGKRGVTHQTMRIVVAQLEASGLVRLNADPADRRSRLVAITKAGLDSLVQGQSARASLIEDAIRNRLSIDEQALLGAAIPILARLTAPEVDEQERR
jgi:DNA-binding MarR family transcriptional regulator